MQGITFGGNGVKGIQELEVLHLNICCEFTIISKQKIEQLMQGKGTWQC